MAREAVRSSWLAPVDNRRTREFVLAVSGRTATMTKCRRPRYSDRHVCQRAAMPPQVRTAGASYCA